jgi:uncharacterized membrane protein
MHDDKNIYGKIRLEYVISFADAIFAFSITFMAISIQLPNLPDNNITQTELIAKLLELRPQFETYVISFFIIGIYWISYHQVFNHITGSHAIMIWLNLLFLFFIIIGPWSEFCDTIKIIKPSNLQTECSFQTQYLKC